MTKRLSSRNSSNYQQLQHGTVCGHLAAGHPCAIGPSHGGECRVEQICRPWYDGTDWHCTRARAFGGRCSEGPVPDADNPAQLAVCPHHPAVCQPVRSLRSRRRLVSGLVAASALGLCLILLGGSSQSSRDSVFATTGIVSAGPLSAHHATMQAGCSACHSAADQSAMGLLRCALGGAGGISESRRCLQCHQELGEHALHPHSIDPNELHDAVHGEQENPSHTVQQVLSRLLASPQATGAGEIACATCHHEHRGAAYDLTSMTNAKCQSCHSSTFHSLTDGHPEFRDPPRADLHFDHVTHLNLHFNSFERTMPAGVPRMQCKDCHTPDSGGATMKLRSFDVMCASCHSRQIGDVDVESPARLHDLVFINWPETTTDDLDRSPLMQLLFDGGAEDGADPVELISDLVRNGEETLRQRLHMVVSPSTESAVIEACIEALTQSHFFDAIAVFEEGQTKSPSVPESRSYGSWRLADGGSRLVYDCNQHADAVLRSWVDLAAANARQYPEAPAPNEAGQFDRLLRDLTAPESTGRCMKCHTLDPHPAGGFRVNWNSRHGNQLSKYFTRFSHKPHLTLLSSPEQVWATGSDERCESCHALNHESFGLVKPIFVLEDGMPNPAGVSCSGVGFHSIERRSCAQCHTQQLAGDNCLQCHNYHIHRLPETRHTHIEGRR